MKKLDYWKKWKLFELFEHLFKAEELLVGVEDNQNDDFFSFRETFIEELYELQGDNVPDFTRLWEWFSPNKQWDTIVGTPGKELGSRIFPILDNWRRNAPRSS